MNGDEFVSHYVCTLDQARELITVHERFWINNCFCRERRGGCKQSRIDVELWFRGDFANLPPAFRQATEAEVRNLLEEAETKYLVPRPFRNARDRETVEGICFCCADCCEFFTNPEYVCDKGTLTERTDHDECSLCGECIDVCYFDARHLDDDRLVIQSDRCYGCGLCAEACSAECIEMVPISD